MPFVVCQHLVFGAIVLGLLGWVVVRGFWLFGGVPGLGFGWLLFCRVARSGW